MYQYLLLALLSIQFFGGTLFAHETIDVYKKGVLHRFGRFDPPTDHFTQNIFFQWETETFDVFDKVKDSQKIAIDLGAWIGTTSIWLSKNFHHVISVEPDIESLKCLKKNLALSNCYNCTVCERPVSNNSKEITFGGRGSRLNESISCIKSHPDNIYDYSIRPITLKQLIFDYIYESDTLRNKEIGFIKCDIEGGEEYIIEDLLHFAHQNKCKVYLSFHIDWWKTKKIAEFSNLFTHFKTDCPTSNICEYLTRHPFASLLFEPIETDDIFIKENIPSLIIGYNQLTYIKDMVSQLEKYTSDIVIVDNASNFPPLLDYYANEFNHTLLRCKKNYGHTVYQRDPIKKLMGNLYILTDPDLSFNAKLPDDFISTLITLSLYFKAHKVGFALCIDADNLRPNLTILNMHFTEWEKKFWVNKILFERDKSLELYDAQIDTTFCLVNEKFNHTYRNVRVAGNYTCIHRPWHTNYLDNFLPGEYENYLKDNISTNYFEAKKTSGP